MSATIVNISDTSFDQDVLESSTPVLVDFWAQWCGPCKAIAPILEEISKELGAKIKIAKLDVDHNPETPSKFGIRGIPTLILFKDGQVKATQVGLVAKNDLISFINENI